jgi:1-deoxy-D-xylulose 5-phosphate reductoisomerase
MISMAMQFIIVNLKKISNQFIFNARIKTTWLNENPVKFFLFKQIYFFDIQHIIRLLICHRHHHKFIKYEKRLRKEGNMLGLPINNNRAKSLPLQREI